MVIIWVSSQDSQITGFHLWNHTFQCNHTWMQSNILKGPKKDEMQMALETFTVEKNVRGRYELPSLLEGTT